MVGRVRAVDKYSLSSGQWVKERVGHVGEGMRGDGKRERTDRQSEGSEGAIKREV